MCCAFVVSLLKLALQIACDLPGRASDVVSTPIQAAPVGCLTGRLYLFRPRAALCDLRLLGPATTLFGLASTPRAASPLGAEAGDPYGSQFSSYLIAAPPARRAGRAAPPPAPHPSGVLLAASAPNAVCDPKKHLRPAGSRARRRPLAEGCRWALQPISLFGTTSASVWRW